MKGRNISNKRGFELAMGILDGFGGMLGESREEWENRRVSTTLVDDWKVDTSYTPDTKCFETGIKHPLFNHGEWIIVDEYETREEAVRRHKEWVKHMSTNPTELTSIQTDEVFKREN